MDHFQIRDLRQEDIKPALHLALPSAAGADHDLPARVDHFLNYLAAQDLEIDWKLGIVTQGRLVGSALGVVSPGKVAMILISSCMPETALSDAVTQALEVLEQKAQHAGLAILQSLIPPDCADRAQVLGKAGYAFLADMQYLTLKVPQSLPSEPRRLDVVVEDYRSVDEVVFRNTLGRTYEGSLDCPGLNGLRTMEEIVLSHRHTGIHDPRLWLIAKVGADPVGVVLLTHVPLQPAMEIVYVGVVPEARGCSYGSYLVRLAIEQAVRTRSEHLMLAVDHLNHYAGKIYASFGFNETDRRHAWIRKLRAPASELSTSCSQRQDSV
ncbi:MAG: GNAT family N-acetyltransferase [Planctomycetes bacterium]|nr:GNAT family N-acetyltransferase [Planctomycetota bacterium]